jgi:amino acid transporter
LTPRGAYTLIETVSNMAEEARDPATDVPKAVNLVLIGVYAGISVVALSALPVTHDASGNFATAIGTTPLSAHSVGNSRPRPRSSSVSPRDPRRLAAAARPPVEVVPPTHGPPAHRAALQRALG